jgi:HEAT repeat protein
MTNWTLDEGRRCRAHSTQHGGQCGQHAIKGGTVCRVHGGSAPQVKRSAQERLAEMVDPLLTELFRIAQSGESDAVRLAAIKDALDRAGYKPREKVDVNLQALIKSVQNEDLALLNGDR